MTFLYLSSLHDRLCSLFCCYFLFLGELVCCLCLILGPVVSSCFLLSLLPLQVITPRIFGDDV